MSATTLIRTAASRPSFLPLAVRVRLHEAVSSWSAAWTAARRAAASRRNLARLDDRMLADIGVSAAQAEFEASRWG